MTNLPEKHYEKNSFEKKVQKYIYTEVNIIRYPLFIPHKGKKRQKDKDVIALINTIYENDTKLEVKWELESSVKYGILTFFDRKVFYAICEILTEHGFPISNPIPFTIYNLCKRLGKTNNGKSYNEIKISLERLFKTSIKASGTWYDKKKKKWIEINFHLLSNLVYKGETTLEGEISENNLLYFSKWFLDSWNNHYIKPVDFNFIKDLESPIALRLYEYIGIRFYKMYSNREKYVAINYDKLCKFLQIIHQKYLSKAKEKLKLAHKELIEKHFFEKVLWNDWTVIYFPGEKALEEWKTKDSLEDNQLTLEIERNQRLDLDNLLFDKIQSEDKILDDFSIIIGELLRRDITEKTAKKLIKKYPIEQIKTQISYFDYLINIQSPNIQKNPAGFLRKSIEENYNAPVEYKSPAQIEKKKKIIEKRKKEKLESEKQEIEKNKLKLSKKLEKRKSKYPKAKQYDKLWQELIGIINNSNLGANTKMFLTVGSFVQEIKPNEDREMIVVNLASSFHKNWLDKQLDELEEITNKHFVFTIK